MSKEKAARAGAWSALDIVLRQGVQFVVSIVLARLLLPSDFGLIALLTFFTSLSITFVQGGLSLALVQRQNTTREEESAVFWINLAASLVFGTIIILIAPAVARFYDQPLLRSLMFVAAAQVIVSAMGAVHAELLTRRLQFDQITKTGLVSSLLSAVAGVTAAVMGLGVWALAIQQLTQAVAGTAALWWISDWRPQVRFRPSAIRDLYSFGAFISLSSILEVVYSNGVLLVIGKVYSVPDLGIWNRATSVTSLPTSVISQIIGRTALPLFAGRAADPVALRRGFRLAVTLSMLLTLPAMVGLGILSDLVISALFGTKWMAAAPIMAITVFSSALIPLQVLNLNLLLATGNSVRFLRIEIWKKIFGIVIVGTGCFFGLMGIAYAAFVISVVAYLINAAPSKESIGYGPVEQIKDLRGVLLAAAIMTIGVYAIKSQINLSPWPSLLILSTIGAAIYFSVVAMLGLPEFQEALLLARATRARFRRRETVPPFSDTI
jgi:teichuronic acid exporter